MRFVTADGVVQKSKRFVGSGGAVQDEDVKNPAKLAEVIRQLQKRVEGLEVVTPPEPIEFEVNVGMGGAITTLYHNFNSPVRWYVVSWSPIDATAWPTDHPRLVRSHTSTSQILFLRSYVPGKAIIRVETAFKDVDLGVSVSTNPGQMSLSAQFDTTSLTIVPTGLSFAGCLAGETWDMVFSGFGGSSDASGMKFGIHAPTGATVQGFHFSSLANSVTRNYDAIGAINTLGTAVHTVAGGLRDDTIHAQVKIGTVTGAVGISVAKVTAGTASISATSSLIMTRCTPV